MCTKTRFERTNYFMTDHYVCVHTGYPCSTERLDKKGISKAIKLIDKDILVYGASYMRKDRENDIICLMNHFGDYYIDHYKMYEKCFRYNTSIKTCDCDKGYEECLGMGCERHCMCPIENHCEDSGCGDHKDKTYVNKYYISELTESKWPSLCFSEGIRYDGEPIFIMKPNMKISDIVKHCQDLYYCHIWSDWITDFKTFEYNVQCNGREIKLTILNVQAENG